jgi:hypothetical protein
MYKVGQDNKLRRCVITSNAQIVLKELHEGMGRRHFTADITRQRKLWMEVISDKLYSKILMNFVEVMTNVKELEDF